MAIGYIRKNAAVGKAVSLTSVATGSLVVSMVTVWDGSGTPTLSDGDNAPDGYGAFYNSTTQQGIRFGYWLSSPKSGSVTYTWTAASWSGGETCVFEASHTGEMTLDGSGYGATGSSVTGTSGAATSAETSMVAFGGMGQYGTSAYSSATLDGEAVDQATSANDAGHQDWGGMTMRVMSNPGTYTSAITVASATDLWVADVIAFKEAVASGGLTFAATDAQGTQADSTGGFRTMAAALSDNLNA